MRLGLAFVLVAACTDVPALGVIVGSYDGGCTSSGCGENGAARARSRITARTRYERDVRARASGHASLSCDAFVMTVTCRAG